MVEEQWSGVRGERRCLTSQDKQERQRLDGSKKKKKKKNERKGSSYGLSGKRAGLGLRRPEFQLSVYPLYELMMW